MRDVVCKSIQHRKQISPVQDSDVAAFTMSDIAVIGTGTHGDLNKTLPFGAQIWVQPT